MKKIILFIYVLFMTGISVQAKSFQFQWEEASTFIEVPLNGNIQNYVNIPKAYLYCDGKKLEDARISYIQTGDWLYLLNDVDTSRVGDYQVWYKAVESKYKPGQCPGYKTLVTFRVVDKEPPAFKEFPKSIQYNIGSPLPDYLSKIIAVDNSKSCVVSVDDSQVNYKQVGRYPVFIQASDGYNLIQEEIEVVVYDSEGPIITFLGENYTIIHTLGEPLELRPYFKVVDKQDGDVTSSISYEAIDVTLVCKKLVEVSFYDSSGNKESISITIEVVDRSVPVIELFSDTLILEYRTDFMQALKDNIKRAFMGNKNLISFVDIQTNIKNEVGSYTATYSYEENEKSVSVSCTVKMLSENPPVILVQNIETPLYIKPNYGSYIQIIDTSDSMIESKVEFDDSLVDYQRSGVYPVSVCVVNSSNLSAVETLYVTVYETETEESEFRMEYVLYIGVGIATIGGGAGIFYFKRKKKLQ